MSSDYLEPTRQGRLAVMSIVLAGLAIGGVVYWYSPVVMAPLAAMKSLCDELAGYRELIQRMSLLLIGPGLWLMWHGGRILRSRQSPPPGAWVLHRVLVKRGAHVQRVGWLLIAAGAVITCAPAYFWSDYSRHDRASIQQVCEEH